MWRFVCGYEESDDLAKGTPAPLLFLPIPIIVDQQIEEIIASTQTPTGLRGFVGKLSESKLSRTDLVFGLQNQLLQYRKLSLESLRMALGSRLISLDVERAVVFPVTKTFPKASLPSVRRELRSAERLGFWFGELTIFEIGSILQISF